MLKRIINNVFFCVLQAYSKLLVTLLKKQLKIIANKCFVIMRNYSKTCGAIAGLLTQSVMSATDILGHRDVCGLSAADLYPRQQICVPTIHFCDSGPLSVPGLVKRPRFVNLGGPTGLTAQKVVHG